MLLDVVITERPGPHRPGVWAGFVVPDDLVASLAPEADGRRRLPVVVTLRDVAYRSSLTRQSDGWEFIASLDFRRRTGTKVGDRVEVDVAADRDARTVALLEDVAEALSREGLVDWWDHLAYSHQREIMLYVNDARRPATRARRIEAMMKMGRESTKGRGRE